jgi:putative restriction endonuclease
VPHAQSQRCHDDSVTPDEALVQLSSLRQYTQDGKRYPHKPLLVLLALGRLSATGSSRLLWSEAEDVLAELVASFGPPSRTARAQSAAYPFTRLRSDGVWLLDAEVPMDNVGPLRARPVSGRLEPVLEAALRADPVLLARAARLLVESEFPPTLAPDVLTAAGLDPDVVLGSVSAAAAATREERTRSRAWALEVLAAWDRQCAFCGYDGQLGTAPVGLEAAHVRWFTHDGPDDLDNGLALCALDHKLLDRGALGLTAEGRVRVSDAYTARTEAGRRVYDLYDTELRPRPGTPLPAAAHVTWHGHEVFKGASLAV